MFILKLVAHPLFFSFCVAYGLIFPCARRARTDWLSSAKPTQGGSLPPRRLGRRR
jgi:hypothetical protein